MFAYFANTYFILGPSYSVLGVFFTEVLPSIKLYKIKKTVADGSYFTFTDHETVIEVKPIKINFIAPDETVAPGEWIRVLPRYKKVDLSRLMV